MSQASSTPYRSIARSAPQRGPSQRSRSGSQGRQNKMLCAFFPHRQPIQHRVLEIPSDNENGCPSGKGSPYPHCAAAEEPWGPLPVYRLPAKPPNAGAAPDKYLPLCAVSCPHHPLLRAMCSAHTHSCSVPTLIHCPLAHSPPTCPRSTANLSQCPRSSAVSCGIT